jgi:cell division protein FtsI (penicillin-binding protein 3)
MNVKQDILWRVWLTFGLLCFFAGSIMFYAFKIQVIEGSIWKNKADSLVSYKNIEATRGNILDCNGNLLATSIPIYDIRLDLKAEGITNRIFSDSINELSSKISVLFKDKTAEEYKAILVNARKHSERYLLFKNKIDYNFVKQLKTFPIFRLGRYKGGFMVEQESMRMMPFKHLAMRTIGYKNEDDTKVGLEGAFDAALTGVNGQRLMRKISGGVWMPLNDENEIEPENGKDIVTTLDVNLQDVAEHALMTSLENNKADHGCAILMEVATGEIKAIANLRRKSEDTYVEDFNYAIGDNTEPGSTFKLVSVMCMLEDGLAQITDSTSTEGGEKKYSDRVMKDSESGGYGVLSLQRAFEKSSNVAISKFVTKAYAKNPSQFTDHLIKLGLNKKLGLQISGEAKPLVKTPADKKIWYSTSLPWLSIGYEINVSPMQMITLYNAIANNGKMVKPLLVKELKTIGKKSEKINTEVLNEKICSDETREKLMILLTGVVEHGTGHTLKNPNYTVAGKTGTAQVADRNLGYAKKVYQSSFVGFFPAENPKYTCMVVINNPTGGVYYGALVAGPVFKEIADKVYSLNTGMQKQVIDTAYTKVKIPSIKAGSINDFKSISAALGFNYYYQDADDGSDFIRPTKTDSTYVIQEIRLYDSKVPNVIGMSAKDALYVLENFGLIVKLNGNGKVTEQSIIAGTPITKNASIELNLE